MELVKKVGEGHIFYCIGCKAHHYLPANFIQLGTPEKPTFDSCSQIRYDPPPVFTEQVLRSIPSWELDIRKYECRCRIAGGIIRYWESGKHDLDGYYHMMPLDNITDTIVLATEIFSYHHAIKKAASLGFSTPLGFPTL